MKPRGLARRAGVLPIAVLAFSASVVVAPALARGGSSACPHINRAPGAKGVASARAATICLINAERQAHRLAPVRDSSVLGRAAEDYAHSMRSGRYFSHVSPRGRTLPQRIRSAGARPASVGEALAFGTGRDGAPARIMAHLLASPAHRAIILAPQARAVGIGVAQGTPAGGRGRSGATYVLDFSLGR